jgi:uncharacterized protein YecT (DUF1311 family)
MTSDANAGIALRCEGIPLPLRGFGMTAWAGGVFTGSAQRSPPGYHAAMSLLAIILAAAIDPEGVCFKQGVVRIPAAAAAALAECGQRCSMRELAERFANGDGVERNFGIAELFLCRARGEMAPMEFEGMFTHLQKMRSGEETSPLAFCDYAASGFSANYCAGVRHEKVMPQLERRLETLRAQQAGHPSFAKLLELGGTYASNEAWRLGEMTRGGTGHIAYMLDAEVDQMERFVRSLERWSRERAPAASAAQEKQADRELNEAYRAAVAELGGIDDENAAEWQRHLREAQRSWIGYRDAFAAYYAERWRGRADAEALRREIVTALSRDRAEELRGE